MRDPRTVRLLYELPEAASLALKLSSRMPLSEGDERVLLELAQASGWDIDDIREELGNQTPCCTKKGLHYRVESWQALQLRHP
jgi:hypothetical protein